MKSLLKYPLILTALMAILVAIYFVYVSVIEDYRQVAMRIKYSWMLTVAIAVLTSVLLQRLNVTKKNFASNEQVSINFIGIKGILTIPNVWRKIAVGLIYAIFSLNALGSFVYELRLFDPLFYISAFVDYYLPFVNKFFLVFYNSFEIFPQSEIFTFEYGYLIVQQFLLFGVTISLFKIMTSRPIKYIK